MSSSSRESIWWKSSSDSKWLKDRKSFRKAGCADSCLTLVRPWLSGIGWVRGSNHLSEIYVKKCYFSGYRQYFIQRLKHFPKKSHLIVEVDFGDCLKVLRRRKSLYSPNLKIEFLHSFSETRILSTALGGLKSKQIVHTMYRCSLYRPYRVLYRLYDLLESIQGTFYGTPSWAAYYSLGGR